MKDIAIIGISGVFPEAESVNEFSKNLLNGKCSINEIHEKRLFDTSISDDISFYKAGYLDEITLFDNNFFNISLGEAEEMSPNQRLILQEAYKTFENAGYRLKDLKGSDTSVYVADTETDYYLLGEESTPTLIAGNTSSIIGSRISRFFDLRGLSLNVDTTCSSSLTAITIACKDLLLGETNLALVCGVNINVIPPQKDSKIVLGVESENGSCNPFSENAQGALPGEAVTCVLLKSLEQAEIDNDQIYGVIKGFALNQDGNQSSSIMAPSSDAQADVIRQALKKAGLNPDDITFIEAHGTGTKLGDPIEIDGISQVFKDKIESDEKVYISSVKSNIGHADSAAGLVSLIKVIASFKNNIIYPSVNALPLNSYIDFVKSKVEVVTAPIHWNDVMKNNRKIAGISSFGLMGTNVHLILESYEKTALPADENPDEEHLFCFSAKSVISLGNYLKKFTKYLSDTTDTISDISYTLNNCREIFQYRFVVSAKSKAQLSEILANTNSDSFTDSSMDNFNTKILLFDDSIAVDDFELKSIPEYTIYKTRLLSNAQKSLFIQYSSYQLLLGSGVVINEMIGVGIGKTLLKVLKNEMSLDNALELIDTIAEPESTVQDLEARTEKLLDKYSEGLRIISVGYEGKLGSILRKINNSKLCYNSIGCCLPKNNNLKVLFDFNHTIDPKGFYYNQEFTKVELPSYSFDLKRCWIRLTSNPYHPLHHQVAGFTKSNDIENHDNVPILVQLTKMWNEILKTDVESNGDFFELGGHSLNGSQLINKINERFTIDLNIDDLFENGTPLEMAELVESILAKNTTPVIGLNEIKVVDKQELYDVSFAQKRLWLLAKMSNNTSSLNIPASIVIEGELNFVMLLKAYKILIERHESLRTTFVFQDGKLKQKIHEADDLDNSIKFELKENISENALNDYVIKLEEMPFNLDNESLMRAVLIKIPDNKHVLNITLHHLICDGWSIEILQKELFYIYNSICSGENPELKELKIQYKDFSSWQLERSQTISFSESESFWLNQFKESPKTLNLQLQKSRPEIKTYNGNITTFTIPQELTDKVKEFLKGEDATLTMFFGTILNLFLSKLSGESDITIGMPISDRNHRELENQIGLYLNTIAIRSKFGENATFNSLIKEVSNNFRSAYKHQIYPFELLVENLHLEKDYSRSPLFDVVFTVQNYLNINILDELENFENSSLKLNYLKLNNYSSAQFDLVFRFVDLEDKLFYELEYNTDLFSKETINSYNSFLLNLIEQCLDHKELQVDEISLLSDKEITNQIQILSGTDQKVEIENNIVEHLSSVFASYKNNTAVAYEDESYTYEQLDIISSKLAHYLLVNNNLNSEDKVIVSCEISPLLIAAILGVLKAGLVYVPLDKKIPSQRQSYIFDDVQAKLTINDQWLAEFVANLENIPVIESNIEIRKEQLAYIIYTSGSTGKPKGVMITHQNLMELMLNCKNAHFDLSDNDVWTLYHNYSFDFSIWEIFGPLFFGGKLILIDRTKILDFTEYFKIIKKHKVTVLNFTPKVFAEFDNLRIKRNEHFESLRYLIFGGDTLYPGTFKDWYNQHPSCKIINMYGITEITVHGTFKEITQADIFETGGVSNIGKPLQGFKFYILDEKGKLIPEGFIGEIFINGNQVSKGYFNKTELTEERFKESDRYELGTLYRTGDLARWLPNAELEYIGRIDSQIKINGFRIELNEIGNVLLEHQSVQQAYVTSVSEENKIYLLAYYTSVIEINSEELKNFLKKHLPHYMIPDFIVPVDRIALDSNGKIDKSKFPDLQTMKKSNEKTESAVEFDVEDDTLAKIHTLFCKILNYEEVSISENFFDLGGSSLQLIQLHSEIDSYWPGKMLISDLFELHTIEKIASFLDSEAIKLSSVEEKNKIDFFEI
ncbi:amino acid adenylation domain-containing protein [Flavobacterium sp.]|uniref:amino acid adenylation domain-containing protein n=1 Tax=Flavobacterium sp. TaxID=239 RepID=UPI003D6C6261